MVDISLVKELFPSLRDPLLLEEIERESEMRTIESGEVMMEAGRYIKYIPLVTSGKLKVFREDEEGHELFLYYIYPGETCAISLVCSERDRKAKIKAISVEDTEFVAIPIRFMDQWIQKHKDWYYFVMETYRGRFEEVLNTVDSVAFHKLDDRLLQYLDKATANAESKVLKTTHQDIANELNSSREVISRLLKQLEKRGMVKLSRNKVELLSVN